MCVAVIFFNHLNLIIKLKMMIVTKKKLIESSVNLDVNQLFSKFNPLQLGSIHHFYQNIENHDIDIEEVLRTTTKLELQIDLHKYMNSQIKFPKR